MIETIAFNKRFPVLDREVETKLKSMSLTIELSSEYIKFELRLSEGLDGANGKVADVVRLLHIVSDDQRSIRRFLKNTSRT